MVNVIMTKLKGKNFKKGFLVLDKIEFDHVFKRTVMRSGKVGKIYLPRELIGKSVVIVVNIQEQQEKESVKMP